MNRLELRARLADLAADPDAPAWERLAADRLVNWLDRMPWLYDPDDDNEWEEARWKGEP